MERKNVFIAALWMVVISIGLFFLPLLNGLIGGLVGGYQAGDWKRALVAAVIPAAVVTVALWLLLIALEAPVLGLVTGVTAGILILFADLGIFAGALIGGLISQHRRHAIHV